jgi:CheY-like chemotaxis protein
MATRATQESAQALQWLQAGEKFDLAILDMQMPGMDGLMLAGEIRKLPTAAGIPLVLLTSMGVRADDPKVASVGFASCLTKPIKPVTLLEVLVRVVSGAKQAAPVAPAAKLDPTLATRLPLRVLLCDDNVINQKVALRLLQQMGYRAAMASNGVEALAALDKQAYDLIFMDVMMPEMGGLEATAAIRERQQKPAQHPNYKTPLVIVAMTASAMQGDRERCIAAGMDDYIAKPVRLEDVRAIVERWGATAARSEAAPATNGSNGSTTSHHPESGNRAAEVEEDAPVDMDRLMDFTDGNPESLRELVTLYIEQTAGQLTELENAKEARDSQTIRRLAHSCAGASATCGIRRMVPLLRDLERQSAEGQLSNAPQLCEEIAREFGRVRSFLETQLARPDAVSASITCFTSVPTNSTRPSTTA